MRFIKNISLWLLLATLSFSTPVYSQAIFHNLISQPAAASYDADYQAVLNRATALGYTLPDAGNRTTQNQMVLDLKAAGIWTELDVFYPMLTNIDFATLNWKAPTLFQLTLVNSPTYNASTGFEGNGTTSYLSTNWDGGTNGVQYTQNEAGFGGLNANNQDNSSALFGSAGASGASGAYILPRLSGNVSRRINQSTTNSTTNASSIGRYHSQRLASTSTDLWKNGSSIGTSATASAALNTSDVAVCALNTNGTIGNFSTRQIRYLWYGASLDTIEAAFDAIMATYYP